MITTKRWQQLHDWMRRLGIHEADLQEKFILGSGSGGQKVNKTSSCVALKHNPSGIVTKCQAERSRELNRYYARYRLCEKMDAIQHKEKSAIQKQAQKIKQQKKRRSRRLKQKILEDKGRRSERKITRKKPSVFLNKE
ncbi:MAG: peptide chain release factor-like protein [Gammaproteobacteria bacterium CG_4_10_14_0_8_um_filter_38_16]|nr:MAG: peptide chain release factor-like protein [Gammaproteobacteria bacterium CG_4_10_14_0_8_um_filter_38_16]PJA04127.1 MAG: peptide chain release factor-like protein [Gammaproteobacteria bacterium CG_4_10_14_0_2_um_filter_38_22]PJB10006.1 MAG: peptide chain release factor-like protein [Gammaproteobacteria bacterium CG_4_9_14_3_um_filter_38_9]